MFILKHRDVCVFEVCASEACVSTCVPQMCFDFAAPRFLCEYLRWSLFGSTEVVLSDLSSQISHTHRVTPLVVIPNIDFDH